jgi:hypothetical protein
VLAANAVISYPYTKDVVMSPAGALYAAALYVAVRAVLVDRVFRPGVWAPAAAVVLCGVLAVCWGIRSVGTHLNLRAQAYKVRNEWVYVGDSLARDGRVLTPGEARLFRKLQGDAVDVHRAPPGLPLADLAVFEVD